MTPDGLAELKRTVRRQTTVLLKACARDRSRTATVRLPDGDARLASRFSKPDSPASTVLGNEFYACSFERGFYIS